MQSNCQFDPETSLCNILKLVNQGDVPLAEINIKENNFPINEKYYPSNLGNEARALGYSAPLQQSGVRAV